MNRFKNIKNLNDIIIDSVSQNGISLFKKFNGLFYFKKLIAGSNITISENIDKTEITISTGSATGSANDNIEKFLLEGFSTNGEILHISSSNPLFIKCNGYTDILLDFTSIVDSQNDYIGVHIIENDLIITGDKTNLSIQLNNTKQFSYLFEIVSRSPIVKNTIHTITQLA